MLRRLLNSILIILLFVLFDISNIYAVISRNDIKCSNREMIVLIETGNTENILRTLNSNIDYNLKKEVEPLGVGAISTMYLAAMYQEEAPILISKRLVTNILEHSKLFQDFLNLRPEQIKQKYLNYPKFYSIDFIRDFKDSCLYVNKIYNQINSEVKLRINNYLANKDQSKEIFIQRIIRDKKINKLQVPYLLDKFSSSNTKFYIWLEIIVNIICNNVPYNNWLIKKVDSDIYLLIPKKYLDKLQISYKDIRYLNSKALTDTELKLGLKVNHLIDANFTDRDLLEVTRAKNRDFISSLDKIFVSKSNDKYKNTWSIYCGGHGTYDSAEKMFLPQLKILKKYYKEESRKNPNQEYFRNLSMIQTKINDIKPYVKAYMFNNLKYLNGTIISLAKTEFQKLLKFFNYNIDTAFLYYTSCYSGGANLLDPYTENSKPLVLDYDIALGTLAENISLQHVPFLTIPDFFNINGALSKNLSVFSVNKRTLRVKTALNFKKYFKSLRTGKHKDLQGLQSTILNVNPYFYSYNGQTKIDFISNIPSVRFRNSSYFQTLDNQEICMINGMNSMNQINLNKDVILLGADYIQGTLNIIKSPSCIVSIIPGNLSHVIERITAPNLSLKNIIKPFLFLKDLKAPKVFWIKQLICSNSFDMQILNLPYKKDLILYDVIIMRNVLNSENLKFIDFYLYPRQSEYDYIYFNDERSNSYKIICSKNDEIDNQVIQNSTFKNYKKEILELETSIKKYIKI